jgi:hypothetical protein
MGILCLVWKAALASFQPDYFVYSPLILKAALAFSQPDCFVYSQPI